MLRILVTFGPTLPVTWSSTSPAAIAGSSQPSGYSQSLLWRSPPLAETPLQTVDLPTNPSRGVELFRVLQETRPTDFPPRPTPLS